MSDSNKRRFIRTKLHAEVTLSHPEVGDLNLKTGDVSDGGAYIFADGKDLPQVGELVHVQVQGMGGGNAPVVEMKIVRVDGSGIGLEFVNQETEGD